MNEDMIEYIKDLDTSIITMLKHFGSVFEPNEILLLVGSFIIFDIRANHQPKMYGKFRLSQILKDKVTGCAGV